MGAVVDPLQMNIEEEEKKEEKEEEKKEEKKKKNIENIEVVKANSKIHFRYNANRKK